MPKKKISDVLTKQAMIAMRKEGLSYREIAATLGDFHESTVASYGRRILPPHLQGHVTPPGPNKGNTPKDVPRCRKCTMVKGNYWRPISIELGLCLWCALEAFGIDVDKVRENGLGLQIRRLAELEAEVEQLRTLMLSDKEDWHG